MSDENAKPVQFHLDNRPWIKKLGPRLVLVESSLSEDIPLPQADAGQSYGGPEPTQAFSHETIRMMMAAREEQVEKLRELIKPDGMVFPLLQQSGSLWANVTVGRGAESQITVSDPAISTNHAQFDLDQPERPCGLTDLGSTNGTFINGARVQPHDPQDVATGDCIRFGQSIFYLLSTELFTEVLDAIAS